MRNPRLTVKPVAVVMDPVVLGGGGRKELEAAVCPLGALGVTFHYLTKDCATKKCVSMNRNVNGVSWLRADPRCVAGSRERCERHVDVCSV